MSTDQNDELFERYKAEINAICDQINALPPEERETQKRLVLTGIAARRLNRSDFTTTVDE